MTKGSEIRSNYLLKEDSHSTLNLIATKLFVLLFVLLLITKLLKSQYFHYWIFLLLFVTSRMLYNKWECKFHTIVFFWSQEWQTVEPSQQLLKTVAFLVSRCWFQLCELSLLILTYQTKHIQGCWCSFDTLCGLDWQALNSLAAAPVCSIITREHIDCSCLMHRDSSCSPLPLAFIYDSFLLPIIPGTQAPWGFYMARGAERKLADT